MANQREAPSLEFGCQGCWAVFPNENGIFLLSYICRYVTSVWLKQQTRYSTHYDAHLGKYYPGFALHHYTPLE